VQVDGAVVELDEEIVERCACTAGVWWEGCVGCVGGAGGVVDALGSGVGSVVEVVDAGYYCAL
jgi:hypothetical protein